LIEVTWFPQKEDEFENSRLLIMLYSNLHFRQAISQDMTVQWN